MKLVGRMLYWRLEIITVQMKKFLPMENKSALSLSLLDWPVKFLLQLNPHNKNQQFREGVEVHTYNLGCRNKNAVNMMKCSKSQLNIHDSQGQTELQETLSLK